MRQYSLIISEWEASAIDAALILLSDKWDQLDEELKQYEKEEDRQKLSKTREALFEFRMRLRATEMRQSEETA